MGVCVAAAALLAAPADGVAVLCENCYEHLAVFLFGAVNFVTFIHATALRFYTARRSSSAPIVLMGSPKAATYSGKFALATAAAIGGHTAFPHLATCSFLG